MCLQCKRWTTCSKITSKLTFFHYLLTNCTLSSNPVDFQLKFGTAGPTPDSFPLQLAEESLICKGDTSREIGVADAAITTLLQLRSTPSTPDCGFSVESEAPTNCCSWFQRAVRFQIDSSTGGEAVSLVQRGLHVGPVCRGEATDYLLHPLQTATFTPLRTTSQFPQQLLQPYTLLTPFSFHFHFSSQPDQKQLQYPQPRYPEPTVQLYNLNMKSRPKGKQGHHRDVSKQFMKKNLLNDLYPIPRHKFSVYSKNNHTQTVSKVRNILQFLDFTRSEEVALEMFREKIAVQLSFTRSSLDVVLKGVRAEGQVVSLANRLVFSKDDTQEKIMFLLRGLVSTTYNDVKQIIELLFFYHFLQLNQRQYQSVIREFQSKRIYEAIQAIDSPSSEILTSKILSVIAMIYVKYGEDKRLSTLAGKTLQLRRKVQQHYFEVKDLNVDRDYTSTTFYLSHKYLQAISKQQGKECDILIKINREIQLLISYYERQMILEEAKDLFLAQMCKLKNEVSSKVKDNYYNSNIQEESVLILKKQRTQQALRQFKRRKSLGNLKHKSSLLYDSQDKNQGHQVQYQSSNSAEKVTKGFRQVYNMIKPDKRLSKFSKAKGESGLKKGKKQATIEFARTKIPQNINKQATKKEGTSSLFMKLGIFEYKHEKQKEEKRKEGQKQGRIEQIYKVFANENKVLRDIPTKKLTSDLQHIVRIEMGTKLDIKEMLKREIIDFSAGLAVTRNHFSSFLIVRSCIQVQFLKIWLGQLYVCKVSLNLGGSEIKVQVVLNSKKNTIILHRGNNVLCERYLTIWPTIRYLIHKKLAQLSIFKRYESELLTRNIAQGQLVRLCAQLYFQKFGHISKQEIEEINTCLDNAVKLVLVIEHFASKKATRFDISKDYKFKIASTLTDSESIKLNMLAEVHLNEFANKKLGSLLVCRTGRFYMAQLYILREKLLTSINNKSSIELEIAIYNLSSSKPVSGTRCSLEWTELQRSRVFHHNFVRFFKLICSKVARSVDFTVRFIKFIEQRLQIKESPLFTGQSYFSTRPLQDQHNIYKKKKTKVSKAQKFFSLAQNFKVQIVENQGYLQQPIGFLSHRCYEAFHQQKVFNNRKMSQVNRKTKGEFLWRQEKKINGKSYLIITQLKISREKEFYADYTLISKRNESKDTFQLNHLDIQVLTQPHYCQSQSSESYEEQDFLLEKYTQLALSLSASFKFHYNHHIKKISVISQNGLYCHSFKEEKRRKSSRVQLENRSSPEIKPSIAKFKYGCRLRIAKVVKAANRFAIVTFKRNCLRDKYFWEIVLDYPRKYTQFVSQIDEEKLTYLLSDYHKSSSKQFLNKNKGMFLEQSNPSRLYNPRPSCDSINICLNAKIQEFVDYKDKVLGLFERDELRIEVQGNSHLIQMRGEVFPMQQRVIEQWDHEKEKLYTIWVDNKFLEVRTQSPKEEDEDSCQQEQSKQKSCVKCLELEIIARIQIEYAFRFYEMQNKEDGKEDAMLTKVCHFYLQWCIKKASENNRL